MSTLSLRSGGLARRRLVLLTAVVTGLLVVWAAASPRPPTRLPGLVPGHDIPGLPPAEGVRNYPLSIFNWEITYGPSPISDALARVLAVVIVVILVALAALILWFLVRAALRAWRGRERLPESDDDDPALVPATVLAGAAERLGALSDGTPKQGIVAAWARLEASLAIAGVPLTSSRTSTEVVLATLRAHDVDAPPLGELAALFREARYSVHPLDESDRRRAEQLHRTIDAQLEQRLGMLDDARAR